jgi:transcriptional regulator with XRE-family HTH domain
VDDVRIGWALRAIRIKRRWRQADLAERASVSRWQVSRVERGHLEEVGLADLRRIVRGLDATLDMRLRWEGAELDRLLNARHSAMHEAVARLLGRITGWVAVPEVSFSYYGERGVIDILAWHPGRRVLLVIELKTDLVEIQELVGSVDRKRRLSWRIARDRGWQPTAVSTWVVVAESRSNRRRVAAHATMLRAAFPSDGRNMRGWLRAPAGGIAALGFLPNVLPAGTRPDLATRSRVRLTSKPSG